MRLTSAPNRANQGFTLVELLIAGTVAAIIIGCICEVYFAIAGDWERQQGESDALIAVSMSCDRLGEYITQSMGVQVSTRFTTNDTLAVNLPLDKAYGIYVPTWSDGIVQTRSGQWVVFYLSDTTGSFTRNGDILWAGSLNTTTSIVTPDFSWSLYAVGGPGRITPLRSIRFDVTAGDGLSRVLVTAESVYKIKTTQKTLNQTATFCLRN
ncbi:prepilin-type N-terminal cleavage/methylation domain-containing protein [bacterium]|nr:prepilin-type N-terminal cleavage/methylation domain-containing protein [bacterium]